MLEPLQLLLDRAAQELAPVSNTPLLDAEVLLAHCLDKPRSFLRAWPEHRPTKHQFHIFLELVAQRRKGQPIAYLVGKREFWSREFEVTPAVLIPRPDSELLIELALARLPVNSQAKIVDLGTGSGILAITLAAERRLTDVMAADLSEAALQVAKHNADRLGVANVRFVHSNWFDGFKDNAFELIVSNPPYIAANDPHLRQGDLRFEPSSALVSDNQGLADIERIASEARRRLKIDGQILVEHGYNQAQPVHSIFNRLGFRHIQDHRDLAGNPRVTTAIWNPV